MALELQSFTVDIPTEDLGEEVLYEGMTKKIELKKYYNLDGRILWDNKKYVIQKETPFPVQIVSHKMRRDYGIPNLPPQEEEYWHVFAGDDKKEISKELEITRYRILKTKIVLEGCTGCG